MGINNNNDTDSDGDGGKGQGNNDPFPEGRRRSIQTFAIKEGRWEPLSLLSDSGASLEDDIEIKEEEEEEEVEKDAPKMIIGDGDALGVLAMHSTKGQGFCTLFWVGHDVAWRDQAPEVWNND